MDHGSCVSICPFTYIALYQVLRTFMIPCPYAFVRIETTTRRPPLAHVPLFQRAPPLWTANPLAIDHRDGLGDSTRTCPAIVACQILIFFSYHKRPYQLNLFFGGPELRHAARVCRPSSSCLEGTYTASGYPLIAILGTPHLMIASSAWPDDNNVIRYKVRHVHKRLYSPLTASKHSTPVSM